MLPLPAILADELPAPPALERWFFEQPLPAAVCLLLLGAVALYVDFQRGKGRRGLMVMSVAACLACGVFALGALVRTPREAVASRTSELLERIRSSDASSVDAMLTDPFVVASGGEQVDALSRESFLAIVRAFDRFRVEELSERPRGAVLDGSMIARTRSTIRATALGDSRPFFSTWEFTWRLSGDRSWRLTRLECLSIYGRPPGGSWVGFALRAAQSPRDGSDESIRPTRAR